MSRQKDSANKIQSRRTKTPTAQIIHSAARSIVAFRLSSKNRPQRYRSYGLVPFSFFVVEVRPRAAPSGARVLASRLARRGSFVGISMLWKVLRFRTTDSKASREEFHQCE